MGAIDGGCIFGAGWTGVEVALGVGGETPALGKVTGGGRAGKF